MKNARHTSKAEGQRAAIRSTSRVCIDLCGSLNERRLRLIEVRAVPAFIALLI
jgi:hypothetical protein